MGLIMKKLIEQIELHETLNPKLWDLNTFKLRPEVKSKLENIVSTFIDYVDFPIDIVDVELVGSNCSYNYTPHSDIDLHIIANFENVSDEEALITAFYNSKKASFNSAYDIKIRGIDVEMYIQDVNAGITSNGIYSLTDDEWIKKPEKLTSIPDIDVSEPVAKWQTKIKDILENGTLDDVNDAINQIYRVRHQSIAADGEFGKGNIIFKEIRNLGLLDALKTAKIEFSAKQLSLESLSRGQIVNRYY